MGHITCVCDIEQTSAFFSFSNPHGGCSLGVSSPWIHQIVGCVVTCLSCHSVKQAELTAEMVVHFPWPKHLDKPGIFLFPKLLVCLDCGSSRFTVPETELASVAGALANESATLGQEC